MHLTSGWSYGHNHVNGLSIALTARQREAVPRSDLSLGGARLAHLVVKPAIVNFFDASVDGSELQLDQTSLGSGNRIVGQTLAEANVRQRWGLGVGAVQRDGQVVASPPADFTLRAGDVLVVFGSRRQIAAFDDECG